MASRKMSKRSVAFLTALMTLFALVVPFVGTAGAAHGDAGTAAIDITQVTLSPDTASMPPGGACVQFTATATDNGAVAEGETLDIQVSFSDDDGTAGATGEVADTTVAFCDPDAGGPLTSVTGTPATDTDDDGGVEAAATTRGECLTNTNGQCVFGVSVTVTGTGADSTNGSGTVTAWADVDNGNDLDATEPRDVSTFTVGSGTVGTVSCTPATQTRQEGGRAEFNCTVTNAAGQPLSGVQVTADVTAGPNAEEIGPFNCGNTTSAQGTTPNSPSTFNGTVAGATAGACGYNDAGANTATSPPGTDTVVFCVQTVAPSGQPSTAGCDPHELSAQGNSTASVNWVGAASKISCTPDGATAAPGSTVLITCTVTDINNNPVSGAPVTLAKTSGPGTLIDNCGGDTNAAGQCTGQLTTASNETGTATVTGTLGNSAAATAPTTTNCSAVTAGTANVGAPTGTTCTDTATVTFTAPTTTTPPPACPQGINVDPQGRCFFASNISIAYDKNDEPPAVEGQVTNALTRCQRGRLVRLFVNGHRTNKTDRTDKDGNYSIPKRKPRREQTIKTKAAGTSFTAANGATVKCGNATSRSVDIRGRR